MASKRPLENSNENSNSAKKSRKDVGSKCTICGKHVQHRTNMPRHMRTHQNRATCCFDCPYCDYQNCRDLDYLKTHVKRQHSDKNYKCSKCGWQYASEEAFFEDAHVENCMKFSENNSAALEPIPNDNILEYPTDSFDIIPQAFWQDPLIFPYSNDDDAVDQLTYYWKEYRQRFIKYPTAHYYNFRTAGSDVTNFTMTDGLRFVYQNVEHAFNFNIGLTYLLMRTRNSEPPEFRIFLAQSNRQNIFPRNLFVHDSSSLNVALEKISEQNFLSDNLDRPSTEWRYVATLGMTFFVYVRNNFVAGNGNTILPNFLLQDKTNLITFTNDQYRHLIKDNLCLFRCLVHTQHGNAMDHSQVLNAFEIYRKRVNGLRSDKFAGVPTEHIPLIEELFNISIQIYRKTDKKTVTCLRKASNDQRPIMNVHSHPINDTKVHFSLIKNLHNFAGKHECGKCGRIFKLNCNLIKHEKNNCNSGEPKYMYRGGCYEATKTIFDKLQEFGIIIERERQYCSTFATWDCESILECLDDTFHRKEVDEKIEQRLNQQNIQVDYTTDAKGFQIRTRHKVVTAAVKSNVPGADEAKFFYHPDPEILVQQIFSFMVELSDINYRYQQQIFEKEIKQVAELLDEMNKSDKKKKNQREKAAIKKLQQIQNQFDRYCRQLTILTFNGGRYDLNLVRRFLFPQMVDAVRQARNGDEESMPWPKAITRGSTVLSLATNELRFLDIMLYLSPGINLDKFIKTFNPDGQQKGCFPYELLQCHEDLFSITEFPDKSSFYSTLRNGNITDKEYEETKACWDSLPVKNMLAFVEHYNLRDVSPFLLACERMSLMYWQDFEIDIFKQAQSIPGVCLVYLFSQLHKLRPSTHFGMFGEEQGPLCQEMYDSICGGLSVIVQRIAEKGETPIRGNAEKLVKRIVGYDFNALYLSAIMKPQPTGHPDHWKREDDKFVRKTETVSAMLKRRKCHGETEYLKFKAFSDNIYIHHAVHGPQTTLGRNQYRIDGYAKDASPRPKVINYNGCFYHYHTTGCLNSKLNLTNAHRDIVEQDAKKDKELIEMGFDVETMWECTFKAIKQTAKAIITNKPIVHQHLIEEAKKYNEYLQQQQKPRKFRSLPSVKYQDMVSAITKGQVFGFAKVDIETKEEFKELYADFPPIIKHALISKDDIGPYMQGVVGDKLDKPRDSLIGSYFGKSIWLMTPIIEFYTKRGLELTAVHEVLLYDKEETFGWFGDRVTENRRQGDTDKSKAALADTWKLLGNSAYGKCITNLKRHQDVIFTDAQEIPQLHNNPFHHRSELITENCFEVHMRKQNINFNLPMIIGLSVYAYAKLRVLEFLYDVLFKFVDKRDYMFLESDTDSIYLGLAADSLEELIKPELQAEFDAVKDNWLVYSDADKRTPGLLKVEKTGTKFIGLCAKSYVIVDDTSTKYSAKGVQPRNADILTYDNYKNILLGNEAVLNAHNIGIRLINGQVVTYIQEKFGLTPIYIKRICLPDGSTLPLDI